MDDAKIVQLYWDRNEQAISATADKYGNYCAAIAKNILGNSQDTEECVNDTYMKCLEFHATTQTKYTGNIPWKNYKKSGT